VINKDYDNKWDTMPIFKNARKIYEMYLARDRIEHLEGELIGDYQSLIDEIRSFLALHKL
ncbi:MAG: hypothetical protein AABX72_02725, partial [Nanoarchaeota archaeon]